MKNMFSIKHRGFTLAEVLVTLGIIGVVAAMTMPTLVANYQKKSYVAQLHKVYTEVGQAALKYKSDHNLISLRESRLSAGTANVQEFVNSYFNVVQDCGRRYYNPSGKKCFAERYKSLNGHESVNMRSNACQSVVTIASGAALCFDVSPIETFQDSINGEDYDVHSTMTAEYSNADRAIYVEVDINGPKGPNVSGRDLFYFNISDSGKVHDADWADNPEIDREHAVPIGIGKIVEDGWEMNY